MYFVARPLGAAFLAVTRFHVVRRANQLGRRGQIFRRAPAHGPICGVKLLDPDPAQPLHGWHCTQPSRSAVSIDHFQEMEPIRANGFSQGVALGATWGQPIVLKPPSVSIEPVGGTWPRSQSGATTPAY